MAMACIGPFCGKFPNIHEESSTSSDDDDDRGDPATQHMVAKRPRSRWAEFMRRRRKRGQDRNRSATIGGTGQFKWGQYMTPISVQVKLRKGQEEKLTQQFLQLKAVDVDLTPDMVRSIPRSRVHTIIINKCHQDDIPPGLNEVEDLRVLRMSFNRLTKFSEDLNKCGRLERIILDNNSIGTGAGVQVGIFSSDGNGANPTFKELEVLNLASNRLDSLPKDFVAPQLLHLDLSSNSLETLPESILECKELQVLEISHNNLRRLPEGSSGFVFKNLQRFFASFNQLEALPKDIGSCQELVKIRIVNNRIRELPESILQLWKREGSDSEGTSGKLEELLVERNPLVMPSITAFEMERGIRGVHRAFRLFEQFIEAKKQDEAKVNALALPPAPGAQGADLLALPASIAEESAEGKAKAKAKAKSKGTEKSPEAEEAATPKASKNPTLAGMEYYFAACGDEPDQLSVVDVRNAESALLLRKKHMYIQDRISEAHEKGANQHHKDEKGGKHKARDKVINFMDFGDAGDVSAAQFSSVQVHVTDLDIYFSLLVLTSKPMFSACQTLFDKFETTNTDNKTMNAEDWNELCTSVLVNMPEEYREKIWDLLAWRDSECIWLRDFVAGWHLHDLGVKDPWLKQICKVLNLDYYSMTPDDLEARLRNRGSQDATPQLEHEVDSDYEKEDVLDKESGMLKVSGDPNSQENDSLPAGYVYPIPKVDGERTVFQRTKLESSRRNFVETDETEEDVVPPLVRPVSLARTASSTTAAPESDWKVSMTDQQYAQYVNLKTDADATDEVNRVSSSLLSESESQDTDFDAFYAVEKMQDPMSQNQTQLVVNSDEKLRLLMEMPLEPGRKKPDTASDTPWRSSGPELAAKRKRKRKMRKRIKDSGFNTDVFQVRQAVREAFRNMPFDDFVKLVNFLLRGLQTIKHKGKTAQTYWHANDPTFLCTMGEGEKNGYTRSLLECMGFVMLNDLYWIWPEKHITMSAHDRQTWGEERIPPRCPGRDPDRLDDMIRLFQLTQRSIHREGRGGFKGHVRSEGISRSPNS